MLGALNVLTAILAARMIVLVSTGGAILLAWLALETPDLIRSGVLAIYVAGVVGPSVWLSSRR